MTRCGHYHRARAIPARRRRNAVPSRRPRAGRGHVRVADLDDRSLVVAERRLAVHRAQHDHAVLVVPVPGTPRSRPAGCVPAHRRYDPRGPARLPGRDRHHRGGLCGQRARLGPCVRARRARFDARVAPALHRGAVPGVGGADAVVGRLGPRPPPADEPRPYGHRRLPVDGIPEPPRPGLVRPRLRRRPVLLAQERAADRARRGRAAGPDRGLAAPALTHDRRARHRARRPHRAVPSAIPTHHLAQHGKLRPGAHARGPLLRGLRAAVRPWVLGHAPPVPAGWPVGQHADRHLPVQPARTGRHHDLPRRVRRGPGMAGPPPPAHPVAAAPPHRLHHAEPGHRALQSRAPRTSGT